MVTENSIFGDIISSYSRKQAIEDGVLIDLTLKAKTMGILYSFACTPGVANLLADSTDELLFFGLFRVHARKTAGRRIDFKFKGTELYSMVGPGDTAEPVITVMLIGED